MVVFRDSNQLIPTALGVGGCSATVNQPGYLSAHTKETNTLFVRSGFFFWRERSNESPSRLKHWHKRWFATCRHASTGLLFIWKGEVSLFHLCSPVEWQAGLIPLSPVTVEIKHMSLLYKTGFRTGNTSAPCKWHGWGTAVHTLYFLTYSMDPCVQCHKQS